MYSGLKKKLNKFMVMRLKCSFSFAKTTFNIYKLKEKYILDSKFRFNMGNKNFFLKRYEHNGYEIKPFQ